MYYDRQSFQIMTRKKGGGYCTRSDEFCEYPLLEKMHFRVVLAEVRVTKILTYYSILTELRCYSLKTPLVLIVSLSVC